MRPLPGVLGARDLPIGAVDESVTAITEQAALRDVGAVQLLSHHRLYGIAPQSDY